MSSRCAQESFCIISSFLHPAIRGGPRSSAGPQATPKPGKRNEEDTIIDLMNG